MSTVREELISVAGFLAQRSVTRLEMCVTEKDGVAGPWRALLPRQTDLPGTLASNLGRGAIVDLRLPQLDLILRLWTEGQQLRAGFEPSDHPVAAEFQALGIG